MDLESVDDAELVEAVPDAHLAQLAAGENASMQFFHIEPGATVPQHHHHHEQLGYVWQGEITFLVGEDGEEVVVGPGDSYVLASVEVHAAENRCEETVEGVEVFSPPRTNPDWAE